MNTDKSTRSILLARIPSLRAFAFSLCGNRDEADDLVQETLLSAWAHLDRFQDGTNMGAWLFTILRNHYRTKWRKGRRMVADVNGEYASRLVSPPEQEGCITLKDLARALATLPVEQREAIVLVGASGMSVHDAAEICGCEVGTIKSRVNRGRARLAELLSGEARRHRAPRRPVVAVLGTAADGAWR